MPTVKQEELVREFENKLKKLINNEIDYEKTENNEKLAKRITAKKTNEKETIPHLICEFNYYSENNKQVKFKSNKNIDTEINEQDRVLVTDEQNPGLPQEGIVIKKKQKEIIIEFCTDKFLKIYPPEYCRIDLYVKESTYNRQLGNLENLTPNGKYALHFALGHFEPENENKINTINFYDSELNNAQRKAVYKSMDSKHFCLIHGPFGTGKTKTLIEIIRQEAKLKKKILITADSNAAVDNIVERLKDTDLKIIRIGNDKKINNEIKEYSLSIKTEGHPLYQKIEENKKILSALYETLNESKNIELQEVNRIKLKKKKKNEENNELYSNIHNDILKNTNIILTTNTSAALDVLSDCHFNVVIIDEASQTTIPSVLIPIAKADKFILAGDPKQLPPTVTSNNQELKTTLFELLQKNFPQQQVFLNVQNRMNEKIMEFPNREFYNNKLECGEEAKGYFLKPEEDPYHNKSPILFIDTSLDEHNNESQHADSTSIYNNLESKIASKIAKRYNQSGIPKSKIGIITPYVDQVNLIKKHARVNVDTVDGFQGNEKDVIIISLVRSETSENIEFIADSKRLNVTLTRAQKKLIIIGNKKTLKQKKIFRKLIKFYEKNNAMKEYDGKYF